MTILYFLGAEWELFKDSVYTQKQETVHAHKLSHRY